MLAMFRILIWVLASQKVIFVKGHQAVDLRSVHLILLGYAIPQ